LLCRSIRPATLPKYFTDDDAIRSSFPTPGRAVIPYTRSFDKIIWSIVLRSPQSLPQLYLHKQTGRGTMMFKLGHGGLKLFMDRNNTIFSPLLDSTDALRTLHRDNIRHYTVEEFAYIFPCTFFSKYITQSPELFKEALASFFYPQHPESGVNTMQNIILFTTTALSTHVRLVLGSG
jgi:hypothetical protein